MKRTRHGHGSSRDSTYSKYQAMKQRCVNPNHIGYHNYGGRGIKVCERWMNSFEAFLEDMGCCPAGDMTIDRVDSNGDYEPGNCRWLPRSEQSANTRRCKSVTVDGVTYSTIRDAAKALGVKAHTLAKRLRSGWDKSLAVTTPVRKLNINKGDNNG